MAVKFRSVWPTAAAGAMLSADVANRRLYGATGELTSAVRIYMTDDGSSSGNAIVSELPLIQVSVQDSRDGQAMTAAGLFGPIQDPDDNNLSSDLYFWRLDYDGTAALWYLDIFLTGEDGSSSFADAAGMGRRFFANILGTD